MSLFQRLLLTNGVIWTLYVTGYSKLIQITQEIKSKFVCRLKLKLHACTILRFQEYCQMCFHSWLLLTLNNHGYVLHHLHVWSQWVAFKMTYVVPKTVSSYAVNCILFCNLMKIQHCCLCSCGRYSPPLAAHHPQPPTLIPPLPYTCHL